MSGFKLQSNFTAASVAKYMNTNRSGFAHILKQSGYAQFGGGLFQPASRTGRGIHMDARYLSRMANRGRQGFYGVGVSGSSLSSTKTVTIDTPKSYSAGLSVGTLAGVTLQAMTMLNQSGLFSKKGDVTTNQQTAGQNLNTQLNNTFGNTAATVVSGNADVQSVISGMDAASAKDSASLRGAISSAENKLSSMQSTQTTLEADEAEAKNNLGQADTSYKKAGEGVSVAKGKVDAMTKQKDQAVGARNTAIDNFANAKAAKGTAKNEYYKAVGNKSAAEHDFNSASAAHEKAKGAVSTAQGNLDKANAMPAGTPEQAAARQAAISSATAELNAAKAKEEAAKSAMEKANQALENAKTAEDTARDKLSDAEKSEINAESAKNEADTALTSANEAVDTANNNLSEANSNVKIAEGKQKDAKTYFDKLNGAAGKLAAHKKEVETLQKEITKYKGKLTDLEAKENKKLNALHDENDAIDNKRTKKDGENWRTDDKLSRSETKDINRIARNNEESLRLASLSDESFAAKFANTTGLKLEKNPNTGSTLYFKDGQRITEDDYIKEQRLATTGQSS